MTSAQCSALAMDRLQALLAVARSGTVSRVKPFNLAFGGLAAFLSIAGCLARPDPVFPTAFARGQRALHAGRYDEAARSLRSRSGRRANPHGS